MAHETIQDDHPEIEPKSAPKPEREPVVIDGEATDVTPPEVEPAPPETVDEASAEESAPTETVAETASEPEPVLEAAADPEPAPAAVERPAETQPAAPSQPAGGGGFSRLALGIVVAAVVAGVVAVYVPPLLNDDKKATEEHFSAIDAALRDETSARKALEARLAKLEGAAAVTAQTVASAAADAKAAKSAASASPAAPTSTPVAAAPAVAAPSPIDNALAERVATLETALATQKSEARAEPLALEKRLDPVAEAVAAISLAQRLAEGQSYAAEFAALSKSGADPAALAALKPYADTGAPTPAKLAVAFGKLAPSFATPAGTEAKGGVVDQMMDKLHSLVKVHPVGEIQGDDPAALATQISAALGRGDVAAALATEAKLPEATRAAAASWAKDAAGAETAAAAARSLAETALKRFAEANN